MEFQQRVLAPSTNQPTPMDSISTVAIATTAIGGGVLLGSKLLKTYTARASKHPAPAGLSACVVDAQLEEESGQDELTDLSLPPAVPGLPLIGNLHQLKEGKPHYRFLKWSETYGPIFSIKTGAYTVVVLNSATLAREATITRFSSISTKVARNAMNIITSNKHVVALMDSGNFQKQAKRSFMLSLLGAPALKRHRDLRDALVGNISKRLLEEIRLQDSLGAINVRDVILPEFFRFSMKQALGKDVESVFVEELGEEVGTMGMYKSLVHDPIETTMEKDWRDFFPYLRWVPNRSFEAKLEPVVARRTAIANALIAQQKKRIAAGESVDCYLDFMLSGAGGALTEEDVMFFTWEAILEAADTIVVTAEWALYELARNPDCQEKLYKEIKEVCGTEKITEEDFPKMPYLRAIFQETLRRHPASSMVPFRHVHEDTQIGGYRIPAGSHIAINIYGCNMNKNDWAEPEEWRPERFIEGNFEAMDFYNNKTVTFGGGKRICPGAPLAKLLVTIVIGRLMQEFQWQLKDGEGGSEEDTAKFTGMKLHPLFAYLTPREIGVAK